MAKKINSELFASILELVSEGRTLKQACLDLGVEMRDFNRYKAANPHLLEAIQRARRDGTFSLGDEIIEISDTDEDYNRARVRIDARKFYVSKINPEVFGERIDVNVQAMPNMDRILDKIDALLLPNRDPSNIIDAEVIETKEISGDCTTGSKPVEYKDAPKIEAIETDIKAKKPNDKAN